MADYIYTMESRLAPEQMRALNAVQQIARSHGINVYLTGGAIRDILTGFPIRDLDFTVQGNPLKLQHDIEKSGGNVDMTDPVTGVLHAILHGTQVEITMARAEVFDKPGKPPLVTPATINEDLRRRDFTFNAMALSLNDGSRGLLLDPFNGAADIEARLIRVLHSYSFLEDPSRLIRAARFATRFGWEMEERTRARYDSAREGDYIHFIGSRAIGYEIEQVAREENPIAVMRALEGEGWLKVLWPRWTVAKADSSEFAQLLKTRATMTDLNITVDAAPAVMHFLTLKLSDGDIAAIQELLPHREFVAAWKRLESDAKDLTKKLLSKEAALNSGAWQILSAAKPEALLYLDVTGRNKTADEKIKNFFGKWRQFQEKIPYAQMTELRITPQLPEYSRICQEAFLLLLDGKLRSDAEIVKFLAPFEPPPPPPPPAPLRRGRAAKKAPAVVKPAAEAPAVALIDATPVTTPAKAAVESKPASQKLPLPKKSEKVPEAKSKPVTANKVTETKPAAKKPAETKPAAKAVKAPIKSVSKARPVMKTVSNKLPKPTAPKPAAKATKAVKPATKTAAPATAKNKKKSDMKALEKKKHAQKKPDKKLLKRR
jgi:tRNA nucleotidyltransferase/poly(A) polymerase